MSKKHFIPRTALIFLVMTLSPSLWSAMMGNNYGAWTEGSSTPSADASAWLLIFLLFGLLGSLGLFARYLYLHSRIKTPERELMEELLSRQPEPSPTTLRPEQRESWEKPSEWWKSI